MFDLMMPIMCDPDSGWYATVYCAEDEKDDDVFQITLVDGFGISDLMEYWLREGFALVIDKTRKRGILPMQIRWSGGSVSMLGVLKHILGGLSQRRISLHGSSVWNI